MIRCTNMSLAEKYPHQNDDNIEFQPTGHTYKVAGCPTTISVTRLVHNQFTAFDADVVIDGMMNRPSWSKSPYYGMTREAIKAQWSESGNSASAQGTQLHNDIEDFYNGKTVTNDSIEYQYFMKFEEWRKQQGLVPYRTEWTVYDVPHRLAGTIDMCFQTPDGNIAIYDWKRVKAIRRTSYGRKMGITEPCSAIMDSNYWHYSLQLALYKYILETHYGKKVVHTSLVLLHPDHSNYELHTTNDLSDVVCDLLKTRKSS